MKCPKFLLSLQREILCTMEKVNIFKDRRIAELEQQVIALNTLIDIAEEQGIQIRKKSGAKQ